ncbi:MAG: ATP-binding cassette domain-containing protein [Deltaproteobacteria bacterium]|nr:ATP-binding cassette domain-containing protein [Deltaproteobacteria bacterium]
MTLTAHNISKHYGDQQVLNNVSFHVQDGELLTLLGPSGCGKSTMLRIIAGLEPASGGHISLNGEDLSQVPAAKRQIGFVFQNYALFRHMSVADNIAFGLTVQPRSRRPSRAEIAATVAQLLDTMHLSDHGHRFPDQLSGGQKQRVAVARALAIKPKLLLLDEPFSALDTAVRLDLRQRLKSIQRDLGITCVLVTHDHDEAKELSERVVIMKAGQIEEVGKPHEILNRRILPPNFKRRAVHASLSTHYSV